MTTSPTPNPSCPDCQATMRSHGKRADGRRRFKCFTCRKVHTEGRQHLFGRMRIDEERALTALNMLVEGSSVRATERCTGIHRDTLLRLLRFAGDACERFMAEAIRDVEVGNVELDELWSFIRAKEARKGSDDPREGDSYCFLALERTSKLVLTWHLGRRTAQHCDAFIEKLDRATAGDFQVTSDGFNAYPNAIGYHLGTRTSFATLVKEFHGEPTGERRYSPGALTGVERTVVHGDPDPAKICTSYIERLNLSVRTHLRRWTRLTCAFSKCWENHKAAMSLFLAHYNWCRMHRILKMTPAMKADIARKPWSMRELIAAAVD